MKQSFWSFLFLGFFLIFALPAFAQDEYVEANGSYEQANYEEPVYEEPYETHPSVNANTATANPNAYYAPVEQPVARYDWQSDSKKLRGAGWGLFGGGLGLEVIGFGLYLTGAFEAGPGLLIAGYGMMVVGGLAFTTGCILLIVEAVKFNPYRRGEIAGYEFEWKPDMIVSPEFNGAGVTFRF